MLGSCVCIACCAAAVLAQDPAVPATTAVPLTIQIATPSDEVPPPSASVKSTRPTVIPDPSPDAAGDVVSGLPAPLGLPTPGEILSPLPDGWSLESSPQVPLLSHTVETAQSHTVTLLIRPPLLVPSTDGQQAIALVEPGFSPALGLQQSNTTGALLTDSIHQLESTANQLGTAISQLENLLLSMPVSSSDRTSPTQSPP